jgi:alpha-aminoadipate carrier protein LysW
MPMRGENKMVMKSTARGVIVECPDCGADITIAKPIELGKRVKCPECLADLEVIGVDPVELDWIYEVYDYEDEEDEDS